VTAADTDVLIIGAGPSGLLAAVELARHGVLARVIEREPDPPRQARATALQPGTLEILAQAGLIDEFLASSVHLTCARLFDAELRPTAETGFAAASAGAGCPWGLQCSLPQWRTEQILANRFTESGGSIYRGVEALSLRERDDGLVVDLKRPDGTPETIEARWVIGAGGAHSVTRESMAGVLAGETYPGTALVADVAVECGLPRDGSALIATPAGYVLLAPLPGDRWITFVGDLGDEAERLGSDTSIKTVAAIMARRIPGQLVELTDVGWAAAFRMHSRMTPDLADGRRFLLGDAGHLSSPFGGEGLNSGLHDGHNLAWKLALDLRGRARPGLLDTYALERGAAARHVLEVSGRLHEVVHAAVEAARAGSDAPRPAAAPTLEQAAALVRSRCMLDTDYAGSPLIGHYEPPRTTSDPVPFPGERYPGRSALHGTVHHLLLSGSRDDQAVAGLRRRWAGLVEVGEAGPDPRHAAREGNGVVLVRPDGYLGFRAESADAAGLAAVDAHLGSYLVPA
jgi:6-methylpretetramide 4-monooxygenase / 4-hydroxy-6-methylpretetramide 12a-monooxygenase